MEIVLSDKNRPILNSALASRIKEVASKDSVVGTAVKGLGLAGFYLLLVYAMAKIYQRTLNADDQRFVIKEKEKKNEPSIDFADLWAGEIPKDAEEIVDMLKYPEVYAKFGSAMPRGILLHGPPGTGKTYFAKIIATITQSAFLYASAAQFDEILVGRGAQRIRNLFDDAKSRAQGSSSGGMFSRLWNKVTGKKDNETKPQTVILFIDEIDAIGSRKDPLGMKDTQTVSQLLTCMDGLLENHNVLVLAATNNLNHVDPALLRSGRFDRIVNMDLPNAASREQILKFYLQDKPGVENLAKKGLISMLSVLTQGFNCADLKNLVNEASLRATRDVIANKKLRDEENKSNKKKNNNNNNTNIEDDDDAEIDEVHLKDAFITLYNKLVSEARHNSLLDRHRIENIIKEFK